MKLEVKDDALAPVIQQAIEAALAKFDADRALVGDRLCFSEGEAALQLGINERTLAEERRRGRITYSRVVGSRIRYSREDLLSYLRGRRENGDD